MLPIHTILHPTDFSNQSEYAFRLARAMAQDYHAELIVLHVCPPRTAVFADGMLVDIPGTEEYVSASAEKLERFQPADAAVTVERRVEEGDPVDLILTVAEEAKADLIVMGTHGRTGLSRLLKGSAAEQIVRQAGCPVLTVKTPFPDAEQVPAAVASAPLQEAV